MRRFKWLWLNDGACVRLRPERPCWTSSRAAAWHRRRAKAQNRRRASLPCRSLRPRTSGTHPLRKRPGVRGHSGTRPAWPHRREDTLHQAGQPMGERFASLNSKLRDERLNGEIFTTLREAQAFIEAWRRHYNAVRPHSSLGYRPPAPETILLPASALPYAPLRSESTLVCDDRILNLEGGTASWAGHCDNRTSTWRSFVTISSGLSFF